MLQGGVLLCGLWTAWLWIAKANAVGLIPLGILVLALLLFGFGGKVVELDAVGIAVHDGEGRRRVTYAWDDVTAVGFELMRMAKGQLSLRLLIDVPGESVEMHAPGVSQFELYRILKSAWTAAT